MLNGAGEGIRTPAGAKPTSYLAFSGFSPLLLDLEASAITTPPPRLEYNDCVCGVKTFPAITDAETKQEHAKNRTARH